VTIEYNNRDASDENFGKHLRFNFALRANVIEHFTMTFIEGPTTADETVDCLANATKLKSLTLQNCYLCPDKLEEALKNRPQFRKLTLDAIREWSSDVDSFFDALGECDNLRELVLDTNHDYCRDTDID